MIVERDKIIPGIRIDSYNVWMSIDPICREGDILYATNTPIDIIKSVLKDKYNIALSNLDQICLVKIADGIHKYSEIKVAYICLPAV